MEVSITTLIPLVTLTAALLAGAIAALTLIVNKENKISEFRQDWIDSLREDLTNFLSASRTCTRAIQETRFSWGEGKKNPLPIDEATTAKLRHQAAECSYRIKLRLNQKKKPHIELESLMTESSTLVSQYFRGASTDVNAVLDGVERTATQARTVLKAEWERVKKGELAYRAAKWFAFLLVFSCAILIYEIGSSNLSFTPSITNGAPPKSITPSTPLAAGSAPTLTPASGITKR